MKTRIKKLVSWLYPVQLERTRGELNHDLEVNIYNGKIMLDAATVNYSYGALQEVFDYAFTQTGLYDKPIHSALIPGFGSGSVASLLHDKCDPEMDITGIEADSEVIRLARKYFPEASNEHVTIVHSDASEYIAHCTDQYDLVVVDVFVEDAVPASCQSVDFFVRIKSHLNMQGKMYINKMEREDDDVDAQKLEENIRAVFQDVQVLRVNRNGTMNYVYVGTRKREVF
jgi:spermidine synthase